MKRILANAALLLYSATVFGVEQAAPESLTVFGAEQAIPESLAPITFLQAHDTEARHILAQTEGDTLPEEQRLQLKQHINSAFDFAELGRLALGDHWEERSEGERSQFVETFGSIIAERNLSNFAQYYRDGKIVYRDEEVESGKAVVRAQAPGKRAPVDITYLLYRKEGEWRVYDLVIDDASTAEGYRRRYARYLKKKPFGQLMERLEGQRARLSAQE